VRLIPYSRDIFWNPAAAILLSIATVLLFLPLWDLTGKESGMFKDSLRRNIISKVLKISRLHARVDQSAMYSICSNRSDRDERTGWATLLFLYSAPKEQNVLCPGHFVLIVEWCSYVNDRVHTVMENLEKSWNFKMVISRPGENLNHKSFDNHVFIWVWGHGVWNN